MKGRCRLPIKKGGRSQGRGWRVEALSLLLGSSTHPHLMEPLSLPRRSPTWGHTSVRKKRLMGSLPIISSQMMLLKSRTCPSKQTRVEMNVVVRLVQSPPRWSNLLGTVKSRQAPDATAWDAPPSQPRLRLFPSTYPHPPGKSPG